MGPENTPNPTPTEPAGAEPEVDEFAAMFAHLAEGGDPNVEPGTKDKPAGAAAGPEPTPPADDQPEPEGAAAPPPAPAPPAPAPAPEPAPAPAPSLAPAPVTPPVTTEPYKLYTPDEETAVADLAKEWPDIDRLIELRARKMSFDLMTTMFAEMNRVMSPIAEYVDKTQTLDHTASIYEQVPDYNAAYQPFIAWVGQQTGVKGRILKDVCTNGTASDVADAVNTFKRETSWQSPAGTPAAAPAAAATPKGLSDAAKKAAGSLAPVSTKRSVQPMGADPNDFDAAWAEASAS